MGQGFATEALEILRDFLFMRPSVEAVRADTLKGRTASHRVIEKALVERDTEKRRNLVFDIQRNLAKPMYVMPMPGAATGFVMAWPCLANFRVYRMSRNNYQLWVDTTKPQFKAV